VVDVSVHSSIEDIDEERWDDLLGDDGPPYLKWAFLRALEHTECVHPSKGWMPAHLVLAEAGKTLAVAPAYVKGNSEGEFVFDHSWAQFCHERLGRDYYPKLVVGCPFTPAVGPRLLIADGADRERCFTAFAAGLRQIAEAHGLSSAHVLFPEPEQAKALEQSGLGLRYGVQFHWQNRGYASFDDFLARYNSKRRNQIRRERREMEQQGIELEVALGSDLDSARIDHAYDFYRVTVHKYLWGRQYLNREFFHELCSKLGQHVLVVFAYERGNRVPIAGAFNLLGGGKLYGRYWGATQERRFLHFNVCYYKGIDECIARGLRVFEPGAGGEHKIVRGFEPVITYSAHHLCEPVLDAAVRDFLRRERRAVEQQLEVERGPLKPDGE
jgi:predicted N-acyltransferase